MKEIVIFSIIVAFIGVALLSIATCVVTARNETIARMLIEQTDFDNYDFLFPGGELVNPSEDFN